MTWMGRWIGRACFDLEGALPGTGLSFQFSLQEPLNHNEAKGAARKLHLKHET